MAHRALQLVGPESWDALVRSAQAGARGDQARLLRALAPRVATVLRRTLGTDGDLDDLAQDALAEVLRMLPRVRSPELMVPFAERVAVNLARSRLRRRRVLRFFGFGEVSGDDADEPAEERFEGAPSANPEARAALRDLYRVLDRLPAEERLAFVLRHVERHSLEDTAERLGCSLATAKRRLASCEKRMAVLVPGAAALSAWLEASS
jgi:RNA polymerase sigma-70 factor (ECF subfamily)